MAEVTKKTTKTKKEVAEKKATIKAVKKEVLENKTSGKLTIGVVDMTGKAAGSVTLPLEIFGAKVNPILMAQAVRVYLANQRQGTARTQTRGDVTASKRKIYRQKGTGRARHGALSAPLFIGGGTTFGPKPRDFSLKMSAKMRKAALFSALTQKLVNKEIMVLDTQGVNGKTKEIMTALKALNMLDKKGKGNKVLFVTDNAEAVKKAARNIEGLDATNVSTLSTYTVLNHKNVLFMKDAVGKMNEIYVNKDKVETVKGKE
ncbi:MAG TPA: 50S ribosomal protein L4 [Candidatus Levybacteria bacterium]|nr:50S ribosomal protein L4 [Candidatus Levybacteria bacterium]